MKYYLTVLNRRGGIPRATQSIGNLAFLSACLLFIGCTTADMTLGPSSDPSIIVQAPSNFEAALKHNQTALFEHKGPADVALYNIGLILSHPSNPKKDRLKAMHSFKMLVTEHPRSRFADQARAWVLVLEQNQKNAEEKHRLLEEKRALSREREMLSQERQKLNYTSERSQQLDLEIEKRRRQSLSK